MRKVGYSQAVVQVAYRDACHHMLSPGLIAGAMVAVFSAIFAWAVFGVSLTQVGVSAVAGVMLCGAFAFGYFLARAPHSLARDDVRSLDLQITLGCMEGPFTGAEVPNMDPALEVDREFACSGRPPARRLGGTVRHRKWGGPARPDQGSAWGLAGMPG